MELDSLFEQKNVVAKAVLEELEKVALCLERNHMRWIESTFEFEGS